MAKGIKNRVANFHYLDDGVAVVSEASSEGGGADSRVRVESGGSFLPSGRVKGALSKFAMTDMPLSKVVFWTVFS